MRDLELSLLKTFVAVVETGSLTAAGKRVGRTQPAITHQLNRLEGTVGRPLFGIDKRRLTLTADGEVLLQYALALLRLNEDARRRFSAPGIEGRVVLGTPDLYAAYLLPNILKDFSRAYPRVEVELRCRRSIFLEQALGQGELDLALVTRQSEAVPGDIVRHEPLVWVAGRETQPELEDVLALALLPEGSVYRTMALKALGEAGRKWRIRSVSDSIAGLQAAVLAGFAVAVFPMCAAQPTMRQLGPRDGLPSLPSVELVLRRRARELSQAALALSAHIARELSSATTFRRRADRG